MLLSSLKRLRLYVSGNKSAPMSDNIKYNRMLTQWLAITSNQVEEWLNRTILIAERTEYFDVTRDRNEYRPLAFPITEIDSVKSDITGLFDGGETTESDYFIGAQSRSIVLESSFYWTSERGLKIVYTGGMAYHGTQSTFATTKPAASPTVGKYAHGQSSGACAVVVSFASEVLILDNYYGVFQASEVVKFYDDEDLETEQTTMELTISSITKQSLAEAYPAIVGAVETQVRYYWTHAVDFENSSTGKDGTTTRKMTLGMKSTRPIPLLPETYNMLQPFRRIEF